MGYTHYLYRPRSIPQAAFDAFGADVRQLVAAAPPTTPRLAAGGFYDGETLHVEKADGADALVTPELVAFNGSSRGGALDLSCEDFWVERVMAGRQITRVSEFSGAVLAFDFCKTQRKPYDLVVVAAICAFLHHVPEAEGASDGDLNERAQGILFYEQVTGRPARRWRPDEPTLDEWTAFTQECLAAGGDGPFTLAVDGQQYGWADAGNGRRRLERWSEVAR